METAWAKLADAPTAHTVGTSAEIALLVRQDIRVAIRYGYAKGSMQNHRIILVDEEALAESEVELGILGIADAKVLVLSVIMHLGSCSIADGIEQVASCLYAQSQGIGIGAVVGS